MSTSGLPSNESEDPYYRYESLEGQVQDTIRLLTILPDTGDLIDCTFTFAHLDAQPKYKALSYM
jgi:hypothetical protein